MAPDLTTDVLVIGAGPAGQHDRQVGGQARREGPDDRKTPGDRQPRPLRRGDEQGLARTTSGSSPGRWVNLEVEGARIYSPSEKVFEINEKHAGNEVGYVVERDEFDKQLAIDAANEGVEVRLKTSATAILKENGQIVGAKVKQFGTSRSTCARR